jgi:hypothetical protein
MSDTRQIPQDATHAYRCPHQGETFIKDLRDYHKDGSYITALVWSNTTKRWRKRGERILPSLATSIAKLKRRT